MPDLHPAAIAHRDPAALLDRCEIGGVRRVHGEPGYESGAVLPAGDWAPLSDDLPMRYAPNIFTQDSGLVEFFRLPAVVTNPSALAALVGELGDPAPVPLAATYDPPGEPVTHFLPESGLRPGLHVDNRQNLSFADCRDAPRRFCVNLGPGSRHLLLVTTAITSMCKVVHERFEARRPQTGDFWSYLAARRQVSVLRIRVDPGEGWFAPTVLLPYDESTEDEELPSATASWLGRWGRGCFGPLI
ncbi:hypothetical protein ACFRMQ_06855 [Kitasatospora sp. NPDC056783]|uniref:hypothetical protein n=1 Tax=Kitasatospora sp. NPDC056783 TaxID=3345943 RepID=UPI0036ACC38C